MQHIATSEKSVAASSLPISLDSENESLAQQAEDVSLFKQALSDAETEAKRGEMKLNDEVERDVDKTVNDTLSTDKISSTEAKSEDSTTRVLGDEENISVEEIDLVSIEGNELAEETDWVAYVDFVKQSSVDNLYQGKEKIDKPIIADDIVIPHPQTHVPLPSNIGLETNQSNRVKDEQLILSADEVEALLGEQVTQQDIATIKELAKGVVGILPPDESLKATDEQRVKDAEVVEQLLVGNGVSELNDHNEEQADSEQSAQKLDFVTAEPVVDEINSENIEKNNESIEVLTNDTKVADLDKSSQADDNTKSNNTKVVDLVKSSQQDNSTKPTVTDNTEEFALSELVVGPTEQSDALEEVKSIPVLIPAPIKSLGKDNKVPSLADAGNAVTDKSVPNKAVSLSPTQLDTVVDSIVSVLPHTADSQALAGQIRADINVAAAAIADQQQSGKDIGIDLKRIVDQAIAKADGELTSETMSLLESQVNRNEKLMAISQAILDKVTNLDPTSNQSMQALNATSSSTSSQQNEQNFVTAMDRMTTEGSVAASEQTKSQSTVLNSAEKPIPIHQPEGQKQIAEKIRWMVGSRVATADIRLDPPELGAMQIRVSMAGDTASVSFIVQSTQARDMLAEAQPRLRDMLSEQGIDLGESFVASEEQRQSESDADESQGSGSQFASEEPDEDVTVTEQTLRRNRSPYNVDAYV